MQHWEGVVRGREIQATEVNTSEDSLGRNNTGYGL